MRPEMTTENELAQLGHISGVHGLKGWVKVYSLTEPREAIFSYQPWLVGEQKQTIEVIEGKKQGKVLIARLKQVGNRDQAEQLAQQPIAVYRNQFPALDDKTYYWADLIGLEVYLADGSLLGTVERMMATGANDVMVVQGEKEYLVPFVMDQYVTSVDLGTARIEVEWDREF